MQGMPPEATILYKKIKSIMQYTGFNDKNGKELYDADLFKHDDLDNIIFRVWRIQGGFVINTLVEMWQDDIKEDYPKMVYESLSENQTLSWLENRFEIIGNIYENKNLL
jgi:uncharacterized phage protein (TIGR01671 family)